jgi:hypothetical protein
MPLNSYEFYLNWCSESQILLRGINEIFPIFFTLFCLYIIQQRRCLEKCIKLLSVCENWQWCK